MSYIRPLLAAALFLSTIAAAHAQSADLASVAPLLDEQTLAVGRIDLRKIDVPAFTKLLAEVSPDKSPQAAEHLRQVGEKAAGALQGLTQAGIGELFVVVSLADTPPGSPFLVAPVKAGQSAPAAAKALQEITQLPAAEIRGQVAIVGAQATLERLKKARPALRPEFATALAKAPEAAVQLVIAPSVDARRVLREMLPRLPDEVGGGSGRQLADGVQWAVLNAQLSPRLSLSLTIQSKDADSAAALRAMAISTLATLREGPQAQRIPQLGELIRALTPKQTGDRLSITVDGQDGSARALLGALLPPLQDARTAAGRAQSSNNLKQIMLAMHMYHDEHQAFPPQAIRSKEGKPLLSWRVALLPYLGENALYKEFRLNEPWDSAHNRPLVEKMPPSFASPHLGDALRAKGMTSYLAPLSKQPPAVFVAPRPLTPEAEAKGERAVGEEAQSPLMVFDVPQGTRMRLITDGTSNTIAVVEALPKVAVAWSKPDDALIDPKDPAAWLRSPNNEGFSAGFCDGSVRFIKTTLDPTTLLRLFQMDDGHPLGEF
jgi:hypothetical protein